MSPILQIGELGPISDFLDRSEEAEGLNIESRSLRPQIPCLIVLLFPQFLTQGLTQSKHQISH